MCDKELEVIKMRLMYTKPKLKDLSQGSRIAFVRQFRQTTQDELANKLKLNGERKRETIQTMKLVQEILKMLSSIMFSK